MKIVRMKIVGIKTFLIILILLIMIQNTTALIVEKSLDNIVQESEDIIIGTVVNKESYWEDGKIFTNITILANDNIKGNKGINSQFSVKIRGGTVGNIYAEVSDVPFFENNEEVLLFLKKGQVVGWKQGKYTIKDNVVKETNGAVNDFIKNIKKILKTNGINEFGIGSIIIPHISDIVPGSGPAKASDLGSTIAAEDSTQVVIKGSNFGASSGTVEFWNSDIAVRDATILSWTDTEIVAKVPGRISSYNRPDGTGNVRVITSGGTESDNYGNFGVDYSYGGGKFSKGDIVYKVNSNTYDVVDELMAIQSAAATWNNAGSNFKLIYGGPTNNKNITLDGENSIIWTEYDTGTVATTTTWWYASDNKTIIESDIEFNNVYINWDTKGFPTKMDIQTVATHEFGHWLRLLDLYGSADADKVMSGFVSNGEIKRSLSIYDTNGIKQIYGSSTIDNIAPKTIINGVTEGGVYNSDVTINLIATDGGVDEFGKSGIYQTLYNTTYYNCIGTVPGNVSTTNCNGGNFGPTIYTIPFVFGGEGLYVVKYWSIDNARNIENTNVINFTIDKGMGNSNILTYYRRLGQYDSVLETNDLMTGADNWRNDVVPPGFSVSLTTEQLLMLADEWRNS